MTAEEVIKSLGLQPHQGEGGWFREAYRSCEEIPAEALPARFGGPRRAATAIYYLLAHAECSCLHRLRSDEVWHFYLGDPVEMLLLSGGRGEVLTLGHDLTAGMTPQVAVPHGTWQGCRLRSGGRFALMGTTVSPGFEGADFEKGNAEELSAEYPGFSALIAALARPGGSK